MTSRINGLCFLLFLTTSLFAQSNFKKGYILTSKGDTLKGVINHKVWASISNSFEFKTSNDSKNIENITANNASKVVIEGFEQYESFPVSISMNELQYSRIEDEDVPVKIDTVFLKVITKGNRLNLYSYRDQLKDRFYVLIAPAATPIELDLKIDKRSKDALPVELYKIQLQRIAASYPEVKEGIYEFIQNSNYSQGDLKKIISQINTSNETFDTYKTKIKKGRVAIGIGINYSSISYIGTTILNANGLDNNGNTVSKDKTTTHSYLPMVSVAYDLFFHPEIQHSFIRAELALNAVKSKVISVYKFPWPFDEELTNKYDMLGYYVLFTPQVMFNVYDHKGLKAYAGPAVSVRYNFYPKQKMSQNTNKQGPGYSNKEFDNYFSMQTLNLMPTLRAGAIINKKTGIAVAYNFPTELTTTKKSSDISVQEKSFQLTLNYLL